MNKKKTDESNLLSSRCTIPSDWLIKQLGDCTVIKGEYGINAAAVDYSMELPTYLRITDIDEEGNFISLEKKSVNDKKSKNYILKNGDIVFARTGATVGKTYLHNDKNKELVFAGFLIRYRTDEKQLLPYYLKSYTETKPYWDWVKIVSMRSGQPGINATEYCELKIPLPPLVEQIAIAALLSTWDKAISTAQLMLNLKKNQKKWLSQMLLTGEKRLKGFKGEWKTFKIKETFERVTRKNNEGNNNVVTISAQRGFVKQDDFFTKIVASDILDNYFLVEKGEFCYNKSYSNGYPWGATKRLKDFDKAVVTTLYICFRIKNENDYSADFFEHFFEAGSLDKGLTKIAHEGGRAHGLLNVTPSDFFNLNITIPHYKEQSAIATVLSLAGEELILLRKKLYLLKEQKKGLMQILLTGKKKITP